MRVSFWDLTTWSWLMASAHGAGLMVVPVLLGGKSVFCGAVPSSAKSLLSFHPLIVASAVGVHTISHLVIAGVVAGSFTILLGWRCCVNGPGGQRHSVETHFYCRLSITFE
jgi:hypothetical protein